MSEHARFLAAVHMIIRDAEGKILFQRRQGTKLYNGWLGLPAGHIDEGEHPHEAAIREGWEELGLELKTEECVHELRSSRRFPDGRVYLDVYYDFDNSFGGVPAIREPNKCRELVWLAQDDLPEDVIPYEKEALEYLADENCHFFAQDLTACEDEIPPAC